jgi:bifunctional non-homologous end joining protein LigD
MRPGVPAAALARPGRLPTRPGWLFEVKWDGFRAIVCTHQGLRVRSRRRWDMTQLVPELAGLPDGLMLDGELVAWDDGAPSFPRLCQRVLHGDASIPVTFLVFDLLYVDGESAMCLPYEGRRALLMELDLAGPAWHVPTAFEDGEALYDVVCERRLEGVVAKRLSAPYRPGERSWVKAESATYWRLEAEREGGMSARRRRPAAFA